MNERNKKNLFIVSKKEKKKHTDIQTVGLIYKLAT